MKKALSLLLAVSLLCSCLVGVIFIVDSTVTSEAENETESDLPKVRYYYKNSDGALALTDDSETFDANMEDTDSVDVIFELNFDEVENVAKNVDVNSTLEEVQDARALYKSMVKEYMTELTSEFISNNDISIESKDYSVYIPEYSPFIQLTFETYAGYESYCTEIESIAEYDKVYAVDISMPMDVEMSSATRVDVSDAASYPIATAISDINASNKSYNGSGVNVGILEPYGITNSKQTNLSGLTIYQNGLDTSTVDFHATAVTRILCGSKGVASGVDAVYIYNLALSTDLVDAMEWLTDNDCAVINASMFFGTDGVYGWMSAVIDYYVRYMNVTFVAAAGNSGGNVADLAMGYNVISVAATDVDNNISTYSSYRNDTSLSIRKPTISAPGSNITIGSTDLGYGTSYAAPMVTGVIAKLMSQYTYLQSYPEVVMAAVVASATYVNGQTSIWDVYAGAGRIDYVRAQEAVANSTTFSYSTDSIGYRYYRTISVTKGTTIRAFMAWLANSTTKDSSSDYYSDIHTDYDMYLTTVGNTQLSAAETYYNIECLRYVNSGYTSLRIRLYQDSARLTSETDYGAIVWIDE